MPQFLILEALLGRSLCGTPVESGSVVVCVAVHYSCGDKAVNLALRVLAQSICTHVYMCVF